MCGLQDSFKFVKTYYIFDCDGESKIAFDYLQYFLYNGKHCFLSSSISVIFVLCYAQYFLFINSLQNIISVSNRNLSSKSVLKIIMPLRIKFRIMSHENVCIGIYMILIIVSSTNFSAEIIEYFNGCSFTSHPFLIL